MPRCYQPSPLPAAYSTWAAEEQADYWATRWRKSNHRLSGNIYGWADTFQPTKLEAQSQILLWVAAGVITTGT